MMTTRIRAAWRNAYRAARMGHEVAIYFPRNRRDSTGRYGFVIRPGGHTAWGQLGGGTMGQEHGQWLAEWPHLTRSYRAWYLRVHAASIPRPVLP